MKTYRVNAWREGRLWMAHVPELDRLTHAKNVDEIKPMAQLAISLATGALPSSFDLRITFRRTPGQ